MHSLKLIYCSDYTMIRQERTMSGRDLRRTMIF